jgi:hypothetical protein
MFKRLIRLQQPIRTVLSTFEPGKHKHLDLDNVEWVCLAEVVSLLEPLHNLTSKWSGVQYVTVSCVSVEWYSLIDYYEHKCGSISHELAKAVRSSLIRSLRARGVSYFESDGPCLIAAALDPRFKELYWVDDSVRSRAIASLRSLVDAEEKELSAASAPAPAPAPAAAASGAAAPPPPAVVAPAPVPVAIPNPFLPLPGPAVSGAPQQYMTLKPPPLPVMPPLPKLHECDRYFNPYETPRVEVVDWKKDPFRPHYTAAVHERMQHPIPMQWWAKNASVFPLLSRVARRYLAIPATSTEPERIWSAAGRLCSDARSRLASDSVEKQLFLHHNFSLVVKK